MSDFKLVQLVNPIEINVNVRPTGAYNAATTYGIGDVVSYNNSSYIAIQATTGNLPTNTTYWQLLASSATNKLTTTARNLTGVTIPKMSVVYFSGVNGNLPTLALSQADGELSSTKTIGITATAIANNADGEVIIFGLADSLDTTAFAAGSALWLSPTVAGGMTVTKPSAPNHMVFIGFCTRSHPTSGTIEVKIQNGFELEELHNVAISSVANNQTLMYESATSLWKNHTLVKGDVGLSNVDNTSDANKPVSTAQATAIGLKVNKAGDTMTGPLRIIFNESGTGPTTSHIVFGDAGLGLNASLSMNNNSQGVQIFGGSTPTTGGGIYTYGNSSGDSPGSVQLTLGNSSAEFGLYDHTQSINLIRSDDSGNFTALASVTAPTINVSSATASKVAVLDASKNIVSSTVSTTTLEYLDATSSVQTQLNTKIDNTQSIVNALIFG